MSRSKTQLLAASLAASALWAAGGPSNAATANQSNITLSIPYGPTYCSNPVTLPAFNRPLHMVILAGSSNGGDETSVADLAIMGYNLLGANNRIAWSGVDGSGQAVHGVSTTAGTHMFYLGMASSPELDVQVVNSSQFKICNFGYGGMSPAALVMITYLW